MAGPERQSLVFSVGWAYRDARQVHDSAIIGVEVSCSRAGARFDRPAPQQAAGAEQERGDRPRARVVLEQALIEPDALIRLATAQARSFIVVPRGEQAEVASAS
jgi:hypothetical protein